MAVDFEKLIKQIVVPLVVSPDDVHVKVLSEEAGVLHIQLLVNSNDLGRVIGKGGKIASAIRTIVYAGASKEGKRVHIDIDAY
ncbi:KH domain-containing protein [Acholeplasma equirhinis]|uniref:KH domain-containing protein n=1 Tax=Acholeplasma equirhinis TaxID=555393 RepID=UPI00197AD570|nr:KH domain-containing protein [Acholeplasma equirhinis]MBN3491172.1 KH domain-containing protein [Acholeplasma equirhinis]